MLPSLLRIALIGSVLLVGHAASLAQPMSSLSDVSEYDEKGETHAISTEPLGKHGDGFSDSVEVFSCQFDEDWDTNYDGWPDRWTRLRDELRPGYVRMKIEGTESGIDGRKLTIFPDGASARVFSPPIYIMPKFSYIMKLRLRATNVKYGKMSVRMVFYDSKGKMRQVEKGLSVEMTDGWIDVELGPVQAQSNEVDRVVVQVDFERGERGDLNSEISIAQMQLFREPSIDVHTGSFYNVYTDPKNVVVTCSLSGILERNPEIRFQLLDATNKKLGGQGVLELHGEVISETMKSASDIVDGFGNDKTGYEGSIDWHPPISEYGFYRVRVQMISSETKKIMRNLAITIAVVPKGMMAPARGEFGWSLRSADDPLSFEVLQELLPLTGVSFVKLPVWFASDDVKRGDEFLNFSGQLAANNIEMVAVITDPSDVINNVLTGGPPPPIESLLSTDSSYWMPLFDHVITKLSLQVRWWQLGIDEDTSFIGSHKLLEKVKKIRHQFFRFGQDIRLGLGWRWDYLTDWKTHTSWDFEQLSSKDPMNAVQLNERMQQLPPATAKRWVLVSPNDNIDLGEPSQLRHQNRVRDFVEQIIVAKIKGADAIFVSNPFSGIADPEAGKSGVMNQDGTPGELLLPWRTCALHLSGANYIGSQVMPSGSKNWIFKRSNGEIVMVLWNQNKVDEKLYLGEDVSVVDIWGKVYKPEVDGGKQIIAVDRTPHFVVGLSEEIVRWRMGTHFTRTRIPSIFGVTHSNDIVFRNSFAQGVGGDVRLFIPRQGARSSRRGKSNQSWKIIPAKVPLKLAARAQGSFPFEINLTEAGYGEQKVRIDFRVEGDRDYEFSVWRDMHVGMGNIRLSVETKINEKGRLIITQKMQNTGDGLTNFKCQLYAPPNRRKRVQVYQLGEDVDKKTYSYFSGKQMIGRELKLRLEEVDGERVLIYRFVIDPINQSEFVSDKTLNESTLDQDEGLL